MDVLEMPYGKHKEICLLLDINSRWEELAELMKLDISTIRKIKRSGGSPTSSVIESWGIQNHTVLELFVLLGKMKEYKGMKCLKDLVDAKYHIFIKEEVKFESDMNNLKLSDKVSSKEVYDHNNYRKESEKILNVPKKEVNVPLTPKYYSTENNESVDAPVAYKRSPLALPLGKLGNSRMLTVSDISVVAETAGSIPQIPYQDLQKATNNWDPNSILGKGGFGTVFKGTWKCTKVAIKRIDKKDDPDSYNEQMKQSITELHCLNSCRHDNILPLYGYSIGGPHPCLVYQYMSGDCLERRLRIRENSKVLKWPTRLTIAIGTARGLQFLHTFGEKPLIHGDIKSANILLDPNDIPRIGDFGLAREGPQNFREGYIKVSRIHGTRPYLPEEFLKARKFSTKIDTYSFGIVLFEIATSLSAYSDKRSRRFLRDHVVDFEGPIEELRDKRADGGNDIFESLVRIGKLCVNQNAKERPEMVSVLIQLENVLEG